MNEPIPLSLHEQRKATRPMRWWYESLADFMIAHPSATQSEIAKHFGRNDSTISLIIHSDAFRAYYRQRRNEFAQQLDDEVRGKLFKVAGTSLDNLLLALEKKKDAVPIESLHRTTDMALKNLGYGASPSNSTVVNSPTVVNVAVSVADLEAAREALRRNQLARPAPPLVDAEGPPLDEGASWGAAETSTVPPPSPPPPREPEE